MKKALLFCICCNLLCLFCPAQTKKQPASFTMHDEIGKLSAGLAHYDEYNDEFLLKRFGNNTFNNPDIFSLSAPKVFVLPIGFQVPYYIKPGDVLTIYYDVNRPRIKSSNNTTCQDVTFFETLYDSVGACFGMMSYHKIKGAEQYADIRKFNDSVSDLRMQFLKRKFDNHLVSDGLARYATEYFSRKYIDDMIYAVGASHINNKNSIIDSLIRQLPSAKPDNSMYAWFGSLITYDENIFSQYELDKHSEMLGAALQHMSSVLSKDALDFAVCYLMKYCGYTDVRLSAADLNLIANNIQSDLYKKYVLASRLFRSASDSLQHKNNTVLTMTGIKGDLSYIISSHRGKVLYIDFWASWCTPCVSEMPYSKKLRDHFANKKVDFIYLSIDENRVTWQNASKDLKLEGSATSAKAINLILDNPAKNRIYQELKVSTIPRYVLVDKKGNIVMRDAGRPSEPRLIDDINKLLDE